MLWVLCASQATEAQPSGAMAVQTMPVSPAASVSFGPAADAFVSEDGPELTAGGTPKLVVDLSPQREAYLRFRARPFQGRVTQATLRLFAKDGSASGVRVFLAKSHWEESLLSWSTRPGRLGEALDAKGAVAPNTWVEFDVTRAVYGGGEYDFVLVGTSGDGVDFHSRESPREDLRPQLVVSLEAPAWGCMPLARPGGPSCTYYGAGGGGTAGGWQEGGPHAERLRALAADATGSFVAAGLFGAEPFPDGKGFALLSHAADGTLWWSRTVVQGDVTVKDLAVTPGGHILVVGSYTGAPDLGTGPLPFAGVSEGQVDSGLFIARFSPEGVPQWAQGFEAGVSQGSQWKALPVDPHEVATDSEGNLLVAGGFHGELALGGEPLFAGSQSVVELSAGRVAGGFVAKFSAQGVHLWSKDFPSDAARVATDARTVTADPTGNVLVGVSGSFRGSLPEGPVGQARPFITKYTAGGDALWTRWFDGVHGQIRGVRPLGARTVAFLADFVLPLRFGQRTHVTGSRNWDDFEGGDPSVHLGTLSATGEDGWLIRLSSSTIEDGALDGLVTGEDGTLTVHGEGEYVELGGGLFRPNDDAGVYTRAPLVARYSAEGIHLWSRTFDVDVEGASYKPRFWMEPLPGGALLAGSDFTRPVRLEQQTYVSRGLSDLFFLRLWP